MNRHLSRIALALALACAQAHGAETSAVDVEHRIVLVVDEMLAVRNFPVLLAERLGYLKDANMAVTVMNVRYDAWHGDMLMDGRVDAVLAYYHHNIVNQSQGRMSQAIVTLGVTPGAKVMVSHQARSRYATPADLAGSRIIAGGAGSSKTTVANFLLMAGGHGIDAYTRLGTDGLAANAEALRSGGADLLVAPTPDASYYQAKGVATVFADLTTVAGTRASLGVLFPSSTVFMDSARIKAHPEFAQHLANAFVRTLAFINSHSAEEIMALLPDAAFGKQPDRVAYLAALKETKAMFDNDGRMPADGARREWEVLSAFDPRYKSVRVEQTYTNRFVDEALRRYAKAAP